MTIFIMFVGLSEEHDSLSSTDEHAFQTQASFKAEIFTVKVHFVTCSSGITGEGWH